MPVLLDRVLPVLGCLAMLAACAGPAFASPQEIGEVGLEDFVESKGVPAGGKVYSPFVGRAYPDRILWGDTHLHTNLSPDAGLIGTTLGVSDAYRFARGEKVIGNTGQPVQLIRPLDFLVVTDHAEYIGLGPLIANSDPLFLADPHGKWLHERFNAGPEGKMQAFRSILDDARTGTNRLTNPEIVRSIWERFIETADSYNEPGRFSAMTGFEWTSMPSGNNLHRVVVFRDGADKTSQTAPFSLFDSDDPEDLWKYLAGYEAKTGGNALAIPHNGNLSNGLMFADKTLSGK